MKNLVIVGNGFDLAHGLKTSYWNFIEYLFNYELKNEKSFQDLFSIENKVRIDCKNFKEFQAKHQIGEVKINPIWSQNLFFKKIFEGFLNSNWCDIETQYFGELFLTGGLKSVPTSKKLYKKSVELNEDFEIIKKHLSQFLKEEQKRYSPISVFKEFFNRMIEQGDLMILNFNYTNTIKQYVKDLDKVQVVQIHGEIESEQNPIIFGYAATHEDSRKLLGLENKEYLRNIKKHNYKRTKEENRLKKFLENDYTEVSIIGHSCGLSDKLILNQIFNSSNVKTIRPFYYDKYEHYFETSVNIDRIMNNDENFDKVVNFEDSIVIPQIEDKESQEAFDNKVRVIQKEKQKLFDKYIR